MHLRVLLVLLVGLLVFTFAGAVEVRGRKLYPITWSMMNKIMHLPEPLVFFRYAQCHMTLGGNIL